MQKENLPIIQKDTKLKEAILTISEGRLGTALIVDKNEKLVGILSDGDVRRALLSKNFSLEDEVLKYGTLNPIICENVDMLASDALVLIEEKRYNC